MQKSNDKPSQWHFQISKQLTLSSSDGKYVVSFIKTCQSPEMKLYRDKKKPGCLQTAEGDDALLDQFYLNLVGGR